MTLRPRYSLRTLLVLTALAAGGVKLWYGPHHVVMRPAANVEIEYTYTRDWQGIKRIEGPRVLRFTDGPDHLDWVEVDYYRKGERLNWVHNVADVPEEVFEDLLKYGMMFNGVSALKCWMTDQENAEFEAAVEKEKQRTPQPNKNRLERAESNIRRRQFGFTFPGDID